MALPEPETGGRGALGAAGAPPRPWEGGAGRGGRGARAAGATGSGRGAAGGLGASEGAGRGGVGGVGAGASGRRAAGRSPPDEVTSGLPAGGRGAGRGGAAGGGMGRRGGAAGGVDGRGGAGAAGGFSTVDAPADAAGARSAGAGFFDVAGAGAGAAAAAALAGASSLAGAGAGSAFAGAALADLVALAAAFVALGGSGGCSSRISPSRSARRRTRSACASSMPEECVLTPMPRAKLRSRHSLFVSPSSLASSWTRIFAAKFFLTSPSSCCWARTAHLMAQFAVPYPRADRLTRTNTGGDGCLDGDRADEMLGRTHRDARRWPGTHRACRRRAKRRDPAVYGQEPVFLSHRRRNAPVPPGVFDAGSRCTCESACRLCQLLPALGAYGAGPLGPRSLHCGRSLSLPSRAPPRRRTWSCRTRSCRTPRLPPKPPPRPQLPRPQPRRPRPRPASPPPRRARP